MRIQVPGFLTATIALVPTEVADANIGMFVGLDRESRWVAPAACLLLLWGGFSVLCPRPVPAREVPRAQFRTVTRVPTCAQSNSIAITATGTCTQPWEPCVL